jgi:hypothetical protein
MTEEGGNKFCIEDHGKMVENLNKISDDLLRAKYYFLLAAAALAVGYFYTLNGKYLLKTKFIYYVISVFGNITFWIINEYVISHGFLFRFIQVKAARIEEIFYKDPGLKKTIKDPSKIDNYYEEEKRKGEEGIGKLKIEFIIPDQFVPVYWASIWAIVINTFVAAFLATDGTLKLESILSFSLTALPFIWKITDYHLYKIRKFLKENCEFKVVRKTMNSGKQDFFDCYTSKGEYLLGFLITEVLHFLGA